MSVVAAVPSSIARRTAAATDLSLPRRYSIHAEGLLFGHRRAAQPAQREVDRFSFGTQVVLAHHIGDELIVDVDVRPAHDTTVHIEVYQVRRAARASR